MNKETTSWVHVTTDHDIINTGGNCICRICTTKFVRPTLNHGIIPNSDDVQCNSVPKQKRIIIQDWRSSRGDAWLRRTSANNLLPLENAGNFLKKPLPRCPTVFELLQKSLVLIYPSVRQSLYFILQSTIIPEKKCIQFYDLFLAFEQREHRPNQFC